MDLIMDLQKRLSTTSSQSLDLVDDQSEITNTAYCCSRVLIVLGMCSVFLGCENLNRDSS